ncbi:MAG: manganese efflux pump MntP family protein [Syntrophales bacterium]|nr:manganese efflux pump MntP family protein [Syntrophales bacterium]
MDFLSIFIIAVGLGMDALSVAVGIGAAARTLTPGAVLRLAGSFGLFQFAMPLAGWLAGRAVADHISRYDHWVAFLLLALVGGKMIWESFRHEKERAHAGDPTRGMTLLVLSVATSIDALAVGLSLAFLKAPIVHASIVIGIVCFLMTAAGMVFGRKLGELFGKKAELVGGLVLLGIGIKILWDHLT